MASSAHATTQEPIEQPKPARAKASSSTAVSKKSAAPVAPKSPARPKLRVVSGPSAAPKVNLFEAAFSAMPGCVLFFDSNWMMKFSNFAGLELVSRLFPMQSWSPGEGFQFSNFFENEPHRMREAADPRKHPYKTTCKVGSHILEIDVSSVYSESHTLLGYLARCTDITGQVEAEEARRETLGTIAQRMEYLKANCSTDLANAMASLAKGDLSVRIQPRTPLLDLPKDEDLAHIANSFNELRNQTVKSVLAYNEALNSLSTLVAEAQIAAINTNLASSDLANGMESLASGDLTLRLSMRSSKVELPADPNLAAIGQSFDSLKAETQKSIDAYNEAAESLSKLVAQAQLASSNIGDASAEVMAGNDDLSQRTEEQAASLEETASSMEEMTATVRQNADNAKQANQLAMQAREAAERGGRVVGGAVATMGEINVASKRIADIISVIDEIAFQTNLLALNAAVEAARVGDQGRGFAVVAAEVRNLAGRSATAAKEIKALVQDSVQKVQDGSTQVNESGKTLEDIVTSVKKVADIISEIAAAAQEQAAGIEQVNRAITQMDEITQQNAALVEEASAASQSMNQQAGDLQSVVGKFRLKEELTAGFRASHTAPRTVASPMRSARPLKRPAPIARKSSARVSPTIDEFEEF